MSVANNVKRVEFPEKTKRLVAERAGYKCSFVNCGRLTIGPADDSCRSNNTGIAAHIYGAARSGNGPRGNSKLSEQELKSVHNAIWLCAHHSSLVDKNRGKDFPAGTLHSYKNLHETRIAHELAGIHSPFGWVQKFTAYSSPLFIDSFEFEFAKLNLIVGGNDAGKTAVCEWIAGTCNPSYMERWGTPHPDTLKTLSISMDFFCPNPSSIDVDFQNNNYPHYKYNGNRTPISPKAVRVIFPEPLDLPIQGPHQDRDAIVRSMKLHPYELQALFDKLADNSDYFGGAHFEESEQDTHLIVEVRGAERNQSRLLRMLASSEQEMLMLELGIIAANELTRIGPSLLIFDANSWTIDTEWLKDYAEVFSSPACRFQTIVSTRSQNINFEEISWTGWKVFALRGTPPNGVASAGV